jgi:hypothetical protein
MASSGTGTAHLMEYTSGTGFRSDVDRRRFQRSLPMGRVTKTLSKWCGIYALTDGSDLPRQVRGKPLHAFNRNPWSPRTDQIGVTVVGILAEG